MAKHATVRSYVPPFKQATQDDIGDVRDEKYQRLLWDALRKSINGLINKVNETNVKNIVLDLFKENLVRGRGLFTRSCIKAQLACPNFTPIYAALVATVNTKFSDIGHLVLRRLVLQLKRAYKRNDKAQLIASAKFVAHLINQQVAHEIIALEMLTVLLDRPSDDSVEVAVEFVKQCGSALQELCPKGFYAMFDCFHGILHEGEIDTRVEFLIEGLFAIRKAKFQGFPAIQPELDLVELEDRITHEISLADEIDPETNLDFFRVDHDFLENERKYEELTKSILGEESSDVDSCSDDNEGQKQINDATETDLINLRRTIYLTIMSCVDFEEAGHKLMKINLNPGQEIELCKMLLECCAVENTYREYYGLLGQRLCMMNKLHEKNFEQCFVKQYSMIHRLETSKLRNIAKFFGHLLGTNAIPWSNILAYIKITEEDTTSSSRIFIKILFQELSELLGIHLLSRRLNNQSMNGSFESIFPKDDLRNTHFAINFFTSIGLGGLTENMREWLKQERKAEPVDDTSFTSSNKSDCDRKRKKRN